MTRLPITPGVKERVSANAGRMFEWLSKKRPRDDDTEIAGQAVNIAIAIEVAVTEALYPTDNEGD